MSYHPGHVPRLALEDGKLLLFGRGQMGRYSFSCQEPREGSMWVVWGYTSITDADWKAFADGRLSILHHNKVWHMARVDEDVEIVIKGKVWALFPWEDLKGLAAGVDGNSV